MMNDGAMLTLLGSILTAVATVLVALVRWILHRFDHHDERITELERNHVNQDEFETAISAIYRKLDEGFKTTTERFDQLYKLLIEQSSRKP